MGRTVRRVVGGARLTRRGITFGIVGVAALITSYSAGMPILLYVGCLCLALPLLGVVWVRSGQSTLAISRRFSFPVVAAGSTTAVTLRVDNLSTRATSSVAWRDGIPWRPWVTESGVLPRLSAATRLTNARSAAQLSYLLTPTRRGIFEIGPLGVHSTDPFDLAWGAWKVGSVTTLVVTPAVLSLTPTALSAQAGDGHARVVQRRSAGDDDDAMTREYRRGDAMRRVHWKASARHGSLMVRQEEQHSYPEARIIVDTRLAGYPDASRASTARSADGSASIPAHSARFEWVVAMLASAAVQLRREGFLVTVVETAPSQLTDAATLHRRSSSEQEFLTRLAVFAPLETAATAAVAPGGSHMTGGPVIAIVADPEPDTISFLCRQPTANSLAVIFVVEATSGLANPQRDRFAAADRPPLAEELQAAGWKVIRVLCFDDVADAWNRFVAETRVLRERR
ncbi:MAG: DUF58 domain-containing protein [Rhodoglobus sp.]